MYVCMYVYMYVCMHASMYVRTYVHTHTHIYIYIMGISASEIIICYAAKFFFACLHSTIFTYLSV